MLRPNAMILPCLCLLLMSFHALADGRGGQQIPRDQPEGRLLGAAQPEPQDQLESGGPVLEAYWDGDDAMHVLLGAGGRIDNGIGYFYLSHFDTVGKPSSSSERFDTGLPRENDYRSTRFGFHAEGFSQDTGEGFGLGLFLYNNKSDVTIDRYGLGGTLDLAYVLAERFRLFVGADLMPGFTSSRLNRDSSLLEYELHGGVRILILPSVDIGLTWRSGRTWDTDRRNRLYEDVMAGLRLTF
ncbi:MAG: hypothetical protein EA349_02115 [Halomonadaceae bacterium]|nr:MAG: hypothetical protein EA349_02115 [Halomonadaceae bacterium]